MAKTSLQAIAAVIAERYGLKGNEATAFVTAFFEQIQAGLEQDKQVKVRGLGTFKVQAVKSRESVNVNTGERVVISGHEKMAFTPDNAMKELVNRPFADFETVVIKEGVDVDSIPTPKEEELAEAEEQVAQQEHATDDAVLSPVDEMQSETDMPSEKEDNAAEVQPEHAPTAVETVAKTDDASLESQDDEVAESASPEGEKGRSVTESVPHQIVEETEQPSVETPQAEDEAQQPTKADDQVAEQSLLDTEETAETQPQEVEKPTRKLTPAERFSQLIDGDEGDKPAEDQPATRTEVSSAESPEANRLTEAVQTSEKEEVAAKGKMGGLTTEPKPVEHETTSVSDAELTDVAAEEPSNVQQKSHKTCTILLVVVSILALAGLGVGGYYYLTPQQEIPQAPTPVKANQSKPAAVKSAKAVNEVQKTVENASPAQTDTPVSSREETASLHQKIASEGVDLEEANRYPALRYGAYRIVGVEKKVVLRKGDTMEKLCRRTLGKDMIGYFEAINGKTRHIAGDTILVPKVELRPEYRK